MQNLTDTEKGRLCMAQSSIMVEGRNDWAISQYDAIWDKLPMVGSQILLWRAEMQPEDRPYISATYSRDVALKFAAGDEEKIHGILVKPTAKILPMFLLKRDDPEKEVIIKTECLQVENGYFDISKNRQFPMMLQSSETVKKTAINIKRGLLIMKLDLILKVSCSHGVGQNEV